MPISVLFDVWNGNIWHSNPDRKWILQNNNYDKFTQISAFLDFLVHAATTHTSQPLHKTPSTLRRFIHCLWNSTSRFLYAFFRLFTELRVWREGIFLFHERHFSISFARIKWENSCAKMRKKAPESFTLFIGFSIFTAFALTLVEIMLWARVHVAGSWTFLGAREKKLFGYQKRQNENERSGYRVYLTHTLL